MTVSIDKKIVEMAFQNSEFEKNVGTSLGTIDKLKNALNFKGVGDSLQGITNSAKNVNLNPLSEGIGTVTNRFSLMGVAAASAIFKIVSSAYDAGAQIVKALTVDPIKAGLNEYETKLNSVQTILANTQKEGTNLKQVTDALNTLNEYSDKTIYNFQQMTRNVGTFTAAGVKLDASVAAIKGIANLAAISGSNAEQASTAMYQLSQALSTGTVKLMDWNSVVNAGMGGQVFQDAIKETARVHGVAIDQIIEEEGSFRDSLQRGWFTSEILTETLQKFTGDLNEEQLRTMGYTEDQIAGIIKMGQTATDAATKVKTFTQLFSTLQESAQSGWAQTFEILFGDFEEAKAFFTELNNFFGSIIGSMADARNQLLQGWKDLGGRTKLLEAFQNVINSIITVINPMREAMREIFPPITVQQLVTLTDKLVLFTRGMIASGETVERIKRIFRGVFAVFDIVKMAVISVAKEFGRLLSFMAPVPGGITDILARFGDWLVSVRDMIKTNDTFGKIMRTVGDTILAIAGVIGLGINAIVRAVERFKLVNATEGVFKGLVAALQSFFDFFKNLDIDVIKGFVERVAARFAPLAKLGEIIKNALNKPEKELTPFQKKLQEIGDNIKKALSDFVLGVLDKISKIDFSKFSFQGMFDTLNAGLLSALLLAITKFVTKGTGIFGSITDIFKGISGFAENANGILASITTVMTGVKDILTAWQQQVRAGILLKIAGAIAILAGSLLVLSLIDSEKLTTALAAVTALFADLLGALAIYEKVSGTTGIPAMAKAIGAMLGLSASILLLSIALQKIAEIPANDIVKSVLAIASLSAILVTTSLVLSKNQAGAIRGVGSMILFSIALRALIGPIEKIGAINTGNLVQGLIGLGALLAEISIFMKSMNFKAQDLDDIIGIFILSQTISSLAKVIDSLGQIDSKALAQGLAVLGVLMTGLAVFTKAASGGGLFLVTAAGMLVLSGAMVILADVLKTIGSMSIDELTNGLIGLGGALLIMGVAMNAMNGAVIGAGALLIAAAALAVLTPPLKALGAMSLEQVGIALLALAGVFTVLGLAGAVLTPVVPVLIGLAIAVAALGVAVLAAGAGMAAFAAGLALLATVGAAGGAAVAGVLLAIAAVLPLLAIAAATAIIAFAKVITEGAPTIYAAGKALLLGFIQSVTETMPEIINMVLTGIDTLLAGVSEKLPSIIASGYSILLSFLQGIRNNISQVVAVSFEIVTAYLNAVAEKLPALVDSGYNLIISFIEGLTAAVEEHMPRLIEAVQELGLAIAKGLLKGLISGQNIARDGIIELGQILIDEFKRRLGIASPSSVFVDLATNIIMGLTNGLREGVEKVVTAVKDIGTQMIENFKGNVQNFYESGKNIVEGLARGIQDYIAEAVRAAGELARQVLDTIRAIFDEQSPSKEMLKSGQNLDLGLADGISRFSNKVIAATDVLGKDTIAGFTSMVSKISQAVDENMDVEPKIRPVIDLSAIEAGGSQIDSMFGKKKLNLSVATIKASRLAATAVADTPTDANQQVGKSPSFQFTQINNSPKALSRLEIYRQTRNQLSKVKEMVGA